MTTISPAGTHRPPSFASPNNPPLSLKRTSSAVRNDRQGQRGAGTSHGEGSALKKQRIDSVISPSRVSAPTSPARPVDHQSHGNKSIQLEEARKLPTELVDGFFLGSETINSFSATHAIAPPLPQRPWKHRNVAIRRIDILQNNTGVRARPNVLVKNVPYTPERSSLAPVFVSDKIADFASWNGNHPEDLLTEHNVTKGFTDKATVSNETNSARQSLYTILKHKSGVQTLSALFSAVVDERQNHRRLSTESTFKPPPRATLTESKRKAWLSDLSDPVVPLRKLIRTIPQGIRGQSLLEQCQISNIPVGRAVWFAKCVGANEIRFLKRKGGNSSFAAGGEGKWLRDWTANIEQFLERAVTQCEKGQWQTEIRYALNLAARLYSDLLLDRDHFLDWIVTSTFTATLEWLPHWLMLVQNYQLDLFKHRKRAMSLAQSLLERLSTTMAYLHGPLTPLAEKLKSVVRSQAHANPSTFLFPRSWAKHQLAIEACLYTASTLDTSLIEQIRARSRRLYDFTDNSRAAGTCRNALVIILDSAKAPFDFAKITQDLRSLSHDMKTNIQGILEWSLSKFRPGKYRVHLAVKLLVLMGQEKDIDVGEAVIHFLSSLEKKEGVDLASLTRLVREAIRFQIFSPSRYLQLLTAHGGLSPMAQHSIITSSPELADLTLESPPQADAGRVLTAIPLAIANVTVKNLRNVMLRRAGFSLEAEAKAAHSYENYIASQLPRIFPDHEQNYETPDSRPEHSSLTGSADFEVTEFLRRWMNKFSRSEKPGPKDNEHEHESSSSSLLQGKEFCFIRSIIERSDDLVVLADVIHLCITSQDDYLLASLTDTVTCHVNSFSAMGALDILQSSLFKTYLSVRTQRHPPLRLIFSLIALATKLPGHPLPLAALQQDLVKGEKGAAMAANSPVSDFTPEALQQAGQTFMEEFGAVLSTGNMTDEQKMTQLFLVLCERLEKGQYSNEGETDEVLCGLLARLRIYRTQHFDELMMAWIRSIVRSSSSRADQLLPILITSCSLSYDSFVDTLLDEVAKQTDPTQDSPVANHLSGFLDKVLVSYEDSDPSSYTLRLENEKYLEQRPVQAMKLWAWSARNTKASIPQCLGNTLLHLVLGDGSLDDLAQTDFTETISLLLDRLLVLDIDSADQTSPFAELANKSNDFSMPFCILRFRLWAAKNPYMAGSTGSELVQPLLNLSRSVPKEIWQDFVTVLGANVAMQLREKAEEAFFSLSIGRGSGRGSSTPSSLAAAESAGVYANIVGGLAANIPSHGVPRTVSLIIEKFAAVLRLLNTAHAITNKHDSSQQKSPVTTQSEESVVDLPQLTHYMGFLLKMASIHQAGFSLVSIEPLPSPSIAQKQIQHDIVRLLVVLVSIALHPVLEQYPATTSHTWDVAAMVVDDKPDELRQVCVRLLKDKIYDPRADYLFGNASTPKSSDLSSGTAPIFTTSGLVSHKEGKKASDFRVRPWEMLEGGADSSLNLALFEARSDL